MRDGFNRRQVFVRGQSTVGDDYWWPSPVLNAALASPYQQPFTDNTHPPGADHYPIRGMSAIRMSGETIFSDVGHEMIRYTYDTLEMRDGEEQQDVGWQAIRSVRRTMLVDQFEIEFQIHPFRLIITSLFDKPSITNLRGWPYYAGYVGNDGEIPFVSDGVPIIDDAQLRTPEMRELYKTTWWPRNIDWNDIQPVLQANSVDDRLFGVLRQKCVLNQENSSLALRVSSEDFWQVFLRQCFPRITKLARPLHDWREQFRVAFLAVEQLSFTTVGESMKYTTPVDRYLVPPLLEWVPFQRQRNEVSSILHVLDFRFNEEKTFRRSDFVNQSDPSDYWSLQTSVNARLAKPDLVFTDNVGEGMLDGHTTTQQVWDGMDVSRTFREGDLPTSVLVPENGRTDPAQTPGWRVVSNHTVIQIDEVEYTISVRPRDVISDSFLEIVSGPPPPMEPGQFATLKMQRLNEMRSWPAEISWLDFQAIWQGSANKQDFKDLRRNLINRALPGEEDEAQRREVLNISLDDFWQVFLRQCFPLMTKKRTSLASNWADMDPSLASTWMEMVRVTFRIASQSSFTTQYGYDVDRYLVPPTSEWPPFRTAVDDRWSVAAILKEKFSMHKVFMREYFENPSRNRDLTDYWSPQTFVNLRVDSIGYVSENVSPEKFGPVTDHGVLGGETFSRTIGRELESQISEYIDGGSHTSSTSTPGWQARTILGEIITIPWVKYDFYMILGEAVNDDLLYFMSHDDEL
jgi:hypothetical protein